MPPVLVLNSTWIHVPTHSPTQGPGVGVEVRVRVGVTVGEAEGVDVGGSGEGVELGAGGVPGQPTPASARISSRVGSLWLCRKVVIPLPPHRLPGGPLAPSLAPISHVGNRP